MAGLFSRAVGSARGYVGAMKRVLLTGMSGTGKSTVISELRARGFKAVDTDDNGLSEWVAVPLDEPTGLGPGKDWVWREDRIQDLLSTDDAEVLFVSGCSPNQGRFYPQFDHIVLLTAPAAVIVERLATRTTNPYGKHPDEVARVLYLQQTVEPLLRRGAGLEVVTSAPLDQVVGTVIRLVQ
jgi:shikimate kinase